MSASKTIAVPVERLFDAFVDTRQRKRWLTHGGMSLRDAHRKLGALRLGEWVDTGRSKSTVAVAHERLADADEAETTKAMWKERLVELKSLLESRA